jgi:hypothetical protein
MDRNGAEFPILIAQVGPLNGERWQLSQSVVIGRDPSCEIIIPDRQVSRYHARLIPSPSGVILEDLGSKNGTYCNSARIEEPRVLEDGDLIQVALVQQFAYLSSDATMPLESGLPVEERPARLQLDERARRVWVRGQEVLPPLSVSQFRLLQLLYANNARLVTRDELINAVWGSQEAEGVSEEALDALVRRLRDRLASIDHDHQYIITVRGHGLRLENPTE